MSKNEIYYGLLYIMCIAETIKRISRNHSLPQEDQINWAKWEQKAMEEYKKLERPKKITEETLNKILMDDDLVNYRAYFEAKFFRRLTPIELPLLKTAK